MRDFSSYALAFILAGAMSDQAAAQQRSEGKSVVSLSSQEWQLFGPKGYISCGAYFARYGDGNRLGTYFLMESAVGDHHIIESRFVDTSEVVIVIDRSQVTPRAFPLRTVEEKSRIQIRIHPDEYKRATFCLPPPRSQSTRLASRSPQ